MRLVTYDDGRADRLGAELGQGRLLDLAAAADASAVTARPFASMLALIEAGPVAWERARDLVARPPAGALRDLDGVRLRAPLPLPPQIRDFMCFEKHVIQAFAAAFRLRASRAASAPSASSCWPRLPRTGLPRPGTSNPCITRPTDLPSAARRDGRVAIYSQLMDYECELACVIGQGGATFRRPGLGSTSSASRS